MDMRAYDLERGWEYMERGIRKLKLILEGVPETPFNSEEYMMLYTTVYNMCIQKPPFDQSEVLYNKYKEIIEEYITSTVLPSIRKKHDEYMLRELVKRWSNHKVMVRWLSRFFCYLDRYYVLRRCLPGLSVIGLRCFRDMVYMEVKGNTREAMIALINKERQGELIDRSLLKNIVDIFLEVGMGKMNLYQQDFEMPMLNDTTNYYKCKAANWIKECSCSEYMLKAEESLVRERRRVSHYLHSSTGEKLIGKVQHELLVARAQELIEKENSGLRALLRDDKVDDLSRMFRLFHNIDGSLEPIANLFKQHVIAEGVAFVQQAEEAAKNQPAIWSGTSEHVLIKKIIELHDKYMAFVTDCFKKHTLFHKGLKQAFEIFCNKTVAGSSGAELLTSFCDHILKNDGDEKLDQEAIEEILGKVVKLLAYISEKDLFAEFYRKKLARRLIFIRNVNYHLERNMLARLKLEFGGQFTLKMEGMITDTMMAKDRQGRFDDYLCMKNINTGIDLAVTVLTFNNWPTYKSSDLKLPSEMIKCMEVFKAFYDLEKEGRKLTWIYSLGTCYMTGKFEQKSIELVVSTYQAAALLLFNNADRLSYSDIMDQLNLTHEDLGRVLHSLSCTNYKILKKRPNTKAVSPNDSFEFNTKFTDKMKRIKIPLPPVEKKRKVTTRVDYDRRYAIDASVVRIMKSKKVLSHQQLVSECVQQLGRMFKPDMRTIKRRIEDLINRDYVERDRKDPNTLRYIA